MGAGRAHQGCGALAIYGEEDRGLWPAAAEQLRRAGDHHQFDYQIHSYPGAPHSFFCDTRPQIYRPDAARDAWAKTLAFYRRHLPTPT